MAHYCYSLATEPLGLLLIRVAISYELHKAAPVWLRAGFDDPAIQVIKVDAVRIQPLRGSPAEFRRCQVSPAIQPAACIGVTQKELAQLS